MIEFADPFTPAKVGQARHNGAVLSQFKPADDFSSAANAKPKKDLALSALLHANMVYKIYFNVFNER